MQTTPKKRTFLENLWYRFSSFFLAMYHFLRYMLRPVEDYILIPLETSLDKVMHFSLHFFKWIPYVWAPFDVFKEDLDKVSGIQFWLRSFTVVYVVFIFLLHLASAIAYFGMAMHWIDTDGYVDSLIAFTCIHFFMFLIYFVYTRIVSRWYSYFVESVLENKRDVIRLESSIGSGAIFYMILTICYGVEFGMNPILFPTSKALFLSRFTSLMLGLISLSVMKEIFNNIGAYRNTHPVIYRYISSEHSLSDKSSSNKTA